jgi:hypothetical protein
MRFVLALVAFVVAAGMIALGIAQRTVLLPPPRATVTTHVAKDVRYVVVPGAALSSHPGQQRIHVEGGGTVFAAYGRTSDVTAWLSGERYQRIGVAGPSATTGSTVLTTADRVPTLKAATPHPDPDGADLWLDQQRAAKSLDWTVNLPASVSLLIAADGASPAPSTVTVSWPVHASTPFATPLIVGGSLLVVIGLLLYMWGLVHMKRRRGPRRKSPPRAPSAPVAPRYRQARTPEPAGSRQRSALGRILTTGGVTTAGALLLAGCSAPAAHTAAPVASAVAAQTAAMTTTQATRIVRDVAAVAHRADGAQRASLLTPRFTGPALVLRKAAYATRKRDKGFKLPQALPTTSASIGLTLPEATTTWPRTLFAVITDTARRSSPPLALTLVQDDPRSPYRVQYLMSLAQTLPVLAPSSMGAKRLQPDTGLLRVKPADLAGDYGLLLRHPTATPATLFDTRHDELMSAVGAAAKKQIRKHLGATARIAFADSTQNVGPVVAMATADGGALVSVNLKEIWTVKPVKSGVTVKPSGATKALAQVGSTGKGIVSTYGYQLLFSVPSAGSNRPVQLLGYAQGLTSAKEL